VRRVLVLLPPSEGKTGPRRGRPVELDRLSYAPPLTAPRDRVLRALVALCTGATDGARAVLDLPPGLSQEVARNAALLAAPAAPAGTVYSGVLYDALGLATLPADARRRATRDIVVVSALWGAVRLTDRIPAYRLAMGVSLPGVGPLAAHWRPALDAVLPVAAGSGPVVDLRSATYAAAWRPTGALAGRTVAVRVSVERSGRRAVVSHAAKHHRGEVARHLALTGARPRTVPAVAAVLRERWRVDLHEPARPGATWTAELVLPGD
jgi:hypothetical protein